MKWVFTQQKAESPTKSKNCVRRTPDTGGLRLPAWLHATIPVLEYTRVCGVGQSNLQSFVLQYKGIGVVVAPMEWNGIGCSCSNNGLPTFSKNTWNSTVLSFLHHPSGLLNLSLCSFSFFLLLFFAFCGSWYCRCNTVSFGGENVAQQRLWVQCLVCHGFLSSPTTWDHLGVKSEVTDGPCNQPLLNFLTGLTVFFFLETHHPVFPKTNKELRVYVAHLARCDPRLWPPLP